MKPLDGVDMAMPVASVTLAATGIAVIVLVAVIGAAVVMTRGREFGLVVATSMGSALTVTAPVWLGIFAEHIGL